MSHAKRLSSFGLFKSLVSPDLTLTAIVEPAYHHPSLSQGKSSEDNLQMKQSQRFGTAGD